MTTTKPCPDCDKLALLIVHHEIMLASNPPQTPTEWWCICGYRAVGANIIHKVHQLPTYEERWRKAQDAPS